MQTEWWKDAVVYQIYPRSFQDSNGDGIGDLRGIIQRLDYIRSLGATVIWLCPIYASPLIDNGYDISDYYAIHPELGTMEDFDCLLRQAHQRGLRVIMDLVVNHTSDQHRWFQEGTSGQNPAYRDYYIWETEKPNRWGSWFGGSAWEYNARVGAHYLHIFAKKQPDLNMDNPKVREEVKSIMRFWLDRGVDGFREDVITFISKADNLPDGLPFIPAANGLPFYKDGPHIHEYLAEFRKVCEEYDCFQLGEGPMTSTRSALSYLTGKHKSLDLMFHFDHMFADCIFTEYMQRPFHLRSLKHAFSKWQKALNGRAWNTLYLENHDHPRVISRYGNERYHRASGSMLAVCYLFQQGTPFVYQGQEIGMTNIKLASIDQYVDVSSHNNYHTFHLKDSVEKRMERIHASSRDSARTPMQWDDSKNAGFTTGKPWFYINPNYRKINVAAEEEQPFSILKLYRRCLRYRKNSDVALWGDYKEYDRLSNQLYVYKRTYQQKSLLIVCSFSTHSLKWHNIKEFRGRKGKLVICNYPNPVHGMLKPYEARVYEYKE